jgi:hypothetical protein
MKKKKEVKRNYDGTPLRFINSLPKKTVIPTTSEVSPSQKRDAGKKVRRQKK